MKTKIIIGLAMLIISSHGLLAQEKYKLDLENSNVTVTGTSSIHDWEMKATALSAEILVSEAADNQEQIRDATLQVPTRKLKSHSSIMDKKSWNALQSDQHELIEFRLRNIENYRYGNKGISGTANGTLSIAGNLRNIAVPFSGAINNEGTIRVEGQAPINMKDFNITPPTAMMGALKTGEEVMVNFTLQFAPESVFTELTENQ